ncbi:MAG: hypothetical protein O3A95_03525 [Planctomycetota bacterium]|nr:hypothetical protein [Planctomycetota bacterium]MDA1113352.1 hypothetical protein [Planctomycetota bacterium]
MSAAKIVVRCPLCSYEVMTYSDAVEALEGGAKCLLCAGSLDQETLRRAVDHWEDKAILKEGHTQALDKSEWLAENEWTEGGMDFGDEGEDEGEELGPSQS